MTLRASIALRACPNFVASPLSRGRVRMTSQLHVNKLTQFAHMLTLLTRKRKHLFLRRGAVYTVPLNFYKSRICVSCSFCMITTAAVQGYLLLRSPVRSEMHFTEDSCRNCFQPVTVPLCCFPFQLLFSSLRFSTPHYMQREPNLSRDFKQRVMLPPLQLPPHGTLPSLPSCHQTEADSFSPYGSR